MNSLKTPRFRFNSGYHDGASDMQQGRTGPTFWKPGRHFDKVYEQGYWFGREDVSNGDYTGNSNEAWKSRSSLRAAPWMPHRKGF